MDFLRILEEKSLDDSFYEYFITSLNEFFKNFGILDFKVFLSLLDVNFLRNLKGYLKVLRSDIFIKFLKLFQWIFRKFLIF